jgi:enoyl-CoA hydratase/3-hydroxyacyl-CoA dehydrogenase
VPDHEVFDAALALARKMAQQAPLSIEKIKRVSHQGELTEGLAAEAAAFGEAFGSADAKEGIGAFLGKRQPRFRGE